MEQVSESLHILPYELKERIVQLSINPYQRMMGLRSIRTINQEFLRMTDHILFGRLALGAMTVQALEHHLDLLEQPFSSRLANVTQAVSLKFIGPSETFQGSRGLVTGILDAGTCAVKDGLTAQILLKLRDLKTISIDFPGAALAWASESWKLWQRTYEVLCGEHAMQLGNPNALKLRLQNLEVQTVRSAMDTWLGAMIKASSGSLTSLTLIADFESHRPGNRSVTPFLSMWSAIKQHAHELQELTIIGVSLPVERSSGMVPWVSARTLSALTLITIPTPEPTIVAEFIFNFSALKSLILRSIISTSTTPASILSSIRQTPPTQASVDTSRHQPSITIQTITMSGVGGSFLDALAALGVERLILETIHKCSLDMILTRPDSFPGLAILEVGVDELYEEGLFSKQWLSPLQKQAVEQICSERGIVLKMKL